MTRTDMRETGWHGLGARRIDWIRSKVGNNPETIVMPIYDGHGNMVYTLKRDGTDDYLLGNERIYGAWGDLRQDSNPGDGPNTQYVGNLGHKKDNESGLTYMRARYYEPGTGRFISEEPARDGWNWFIYANGNPIHLVDFTGRNALVVLQALAAVLAFAAGWGLGYALMTTLLRNANPGYNGGNIPGNILFAIAGWAGTSALSLWAAGEAWATADIKTSAFMARLEIMQSGWFRVGIAAGIGMVAALSLAGTTPGGNSSRPTTIKISKVKDDSTSLVDSH